MKSIFKRSKLIIVQLKRSHNDTETQTIPKQLLSKINEKIYSAIYKNQATLRNNNGSYEWGCRVAVIFSDSNSDSRTSEKTTPTSDFDFRTFKQTNPTPAILKTILNPTPTPPKNIQLHRLQFPTPQS